VFVVVGVCGVCCLIAKQGNGMGRKERKEGKNEQLFPIPRHDHNVPYT
jgi:uncharacterized membrane protein YuzA (DUF378 family)